MLVGLTLESTPEAGMGFTSLELHGPSEVGKGCGWETTCVCFTYIVLNIVTSAGCFKICVTQLKNEKKPLRPPIQYLLRKAQSVLGMHERDIISRR